MTSEDFNAVLDRVNNWINNADTKTSILIAVITLIFGISFQFLEKAITRYMQIGNIYIKQLFFSLWLLLFVVLIIALVRAFLILVPRLGNEKDELSFSYFCHIAILPEKEYLKKMRKLTKNEISNDLIKQICINSKIANTKFKGLRQLTLMLAFCLTLIIVLLFWTIL